MHVRAESNWVSLSITYPLRVCLFALLYYFSLRISLSFALINEFVTLFNIAAGIGLALLLRFGIRYWPAILLGACFGFYQINPDIGLALILAAGQTLQALAGVWVLSRLFTLNSSFERIQDVILLMIAGAVLVTFVYPSVAVIGLFINGAITLNEFRFVWLNAWLGEITGVMIFASVLLVWADRIRWEYNWLRYLEAGFLFTVFILFGVVVFFGWFDTSIAGYSHYPIAYIFFPLLAWAAFRLGQRGATAAVVVLSCFALWGLMHNLGPFYRTSEIRKPSFDMVVY